MRHDYLFTSESVSEGHPDKVSDQISDAIVDLFLSKDPEARIACETLTTTQLVVLAGEIRCKGVYENGAWADGAKEEIEATVRRTVKEIGYEQSGFHHETLTFMNNLHGQSAHIAQGVDASGNKDEGAGDQGIMFGYATDETPDLMPATLYYSHKILEQMAADRHSGAAPFLEPDAKSQVTLRYEGSVPVAATAIVVSTQHAPGYDTGANEATLHAYVKKVIADILPANLIRQARSERCSTSFVSTNGRCRKSGIIKRAVLPCPVAESMVALPPNSRKRVATLVNPMPAVIFCESKPWPLSTISICICCSSCVMRTVTWLARA